MGNRATHTKLTFGHWESLCMQFIRYTLVIGKPPYETSDIKTTYKKIKTNSYEFPESIPISDKCRNMITQILNLDPEKSPKIKDLFDYPFMNPIDIIPPALMPQFTLACHPSKAFLLQISKEYSKISTAPTSSNTSRQEIKKDIDTKLVSSTNCATNSHINTGKDKNYQNSTELVGI